MSDVVEQISSLEHELLALTANQPPNPNQMPLYTVTGVTSTDPEVFTIVFEDDIIRLTKAFTDPGDYAIISYFAGNLEVYVAGTAPANFTVVSMGAFHLV